MKKILLIGIALLGFCFQGLAKENEAIERLSGQAFEKIDADGVFTLYLTQGNEDKVSVEVDEEYQKEVLVSVKDGTLKLSTTKKLGRKNRMKCKVYVTFKAINALRFDGVGKLESTNAIKSDALDIRATGVGGVELKLDVKQAKLEMDGVGSVELEGNAKELTIDKDGVGNLDAEDLKAEVLSIKNSGVGNAHVYASHELNLKNSGVGNLSYSGEAVIKSIESTGVGKVRKY